MKWIIIALFLLSIAYVHFRGKVRHTWRKQFFDQSAFLAPLNVLIYLLSRVPTRPYVAVETFPDVAEMATHWKVMLAEAEALKVDHAIKASEHMDDAGFNSFFKEGWTRFYLQWYGVTPKSAQTLCPATVALLKNTPSIKAAMFAELPAGSQLKRHRDPYAGSLRYHLGLATPNDDRCTIWVDGEPHSWRDGQGVIFDETYIHWVHNDTDKSRLILLCDIERPMKFRWMGVVNRVFGRYVMRAAVAPNSAGDKTGMIGKLFRISFVMGQYRRRYKRWNKTVYQLTQAALIIGLVAFLIWV